MAGIDRLVILGDVLELRHGPLRAALEAARPVLAELGEALGGDGEIVLVPGNHDHRLLSGWFQRRSAGPLPDRLGLESSVQWSAQEPLGALAKAAAPAALRVYYPGLWLRQDVYATHGHYLDRHITVPILERLGAGLMTRLVAEPDGGPARAEDYEATLAPMYAWIDELAEAGGPRGRGRASLQVRAWRRLTPGPGKGRLRLAAASAGVRAMVAALNRAGLGPLHPGLRGSDLRRAGLLAYQEVLTRLGVRCDYAIFGHTHRAGPLPGDEPGEWRGPGGAAILNTGSWLEQPGLLGADPGRSPYRPGFCVRLEETGAPELVSLLDGAWSGAQPARPGVKHTA